MLLDVGCGGEPLYLGRYSRALGALIGLDLDPMRITSARFGLRMHMNVSLVIGSATSLPFKQDSLNRLYGGFGAFD